jgi:hypothetical protein
MPDQALARRAGVVRTRFVSVRTSLLLLRERFRVETGHAHETRELLAEDWQLIAFRGAPDSAEWLSQSEAEALIDAAPDANIGVDVARAHVSRVIDALPALESDLARFAQQRAEEIRQAHQRVRKSARLAAGRLHVEPKLPVDVLGIYVYLPTQ